MRALINLHISQQIQGIYIVSCEYPELVDLDCSVIFFT